MCLNFCSLCIQLNIQLDKYVRTYLVYQHNYDSSNCIHSKNDEDVISEKHLFWASNTQTGFNSRQGEAVSSVSSIRWNILCEISRKRKSVPTDYVQNCFQWIFQFKQLWQMLLRNMVQIGSNQKRKNYVIRNIVTTNNKQATRKHFFEIFLNKRLLSKPYLVIYDVAVQILNYVFIY